MNLIFPIVGIRHFLSEDKLCDFLYHSLPEAYTMLNLNVNTESNDMFITSHLGSDSLPEAFSKSDAEHLADTLGVSVGTMGNWLTKWVKSADIQHIMYGEYKKCA